MRAPSAFEKWLYEVHWQPNPWCRRGSGGRDSGRLSRKVAGHVRPQVGRYFRIRTYGWAPNSNGTAIGQLAALPTSQRPSVGWAGRSVSEQEDYRAMAARLQVAARHLRLLDRRVETGGGGRPARRVPGQLESAASQPGIDPRLKSTGVDAPGSRAFAAELTFTMRCGRQLAQALRGERDAGIALPWWRHGHR